MRVLLSNVRVTDPDGERVVLFGGDTLPGWAEGQVSRVLTRDVESEVVWSWGGEIAAEFEVSDDDTEDTEDDEPRYEGDWFGAREI